MKMYLVKRYKLTSLFNERGFTLVDMLLAFSIFLIIAAYIPLSINMIYRIGDVDDRIQRMEWEVFISQVKKEIRMSEHVEVDINNNRLLLLKDGRQILYEKYSSNVRRRVDTKGHEILLQNIESLSFEKVIGGVKISVQDVYDQNHTSVIRTLLSEENVNDP
jgi:competence protein ComGF